MSMNPNDWANWRNGRRPAHVGVDFRSEIEQALDREPPENFRRGNYRTALEQELLAKLGRGPAPEGAPTIEMPREDAGHASGFFWELIRQFFQGAPYPVERKDVTQSVFGEASKAESTIQWGQTIDLSIPGGVTTVAAKQAEAAKQTVSVTRNHPTSFTILSQVELGAAWTGNPAESLTIQFVYTVGVGQGKCLVTRSLGTGAGPFNGQVLTDIITLPLMALQGEARIQAVTLGVETVPLAINATSLVAPVVQ